MSSNRSSLDVQFRPPTRFWWDWATRSYNKPLPPLDRLSAAPLGPLNQDLREPRAPPPPPHPILRIPTELSQQYIADSYPKPIQGPIPAFEVLSLHEGEVSFSVKNEEGTITPRLGPSGRVGLYDRKNRVAATMFMGSMIQLNDRGCTTRTLHTVEFENAEVIFGDPTDFRKKDDRNWSMKAKWTGVLLPDCPGEESCASCCAL